MELIFKKSKMMNIDFRIWEKIFGDMAKDVGDAIKVSYDSYYEIANLLEDSLYCVAKETGQFKGMSEEENNKAFSLIIEFIFIVFKGLARAGDRLIEYENNEK